MKLCNAFILFAGLVGAAGAKSLFLHKKNETRTVGQKHVSEAQKHTSVAKKHASVASAERTRAPVPHPAVALVNKGGGQRHAAEHMRTPVLGAPHSVFKLGPEGEEDTAALPPPPPPQETPAPRSHEA